MRSNYKSKHNNIKYIATKISFNLQTIFWEEFIALEMTMREKIPIFLKIFNPESVVAEIFHF